MRALRVKIFSYCFQIDFFVNKNLELLFGYYPKGLSAHLTVGALSHQAFIIRFVCCKYSFELTVINLKKLQMYLSSYYKKCINLL